ncbi:MAG: C25 family cysteine peptidase [Bacteroidia bacterium]
MTLKSTLTSVVITFFSLSAFAQQSKIELISSTPDETVIKVTVSGYGWKTVQTPQGEAKVITLENGTPILKAGAPDLPKLTTSVIVPDLAGMKVKSTVVSFTDFENMVIAPSKGNQYRTVNMDNVAYTYGEEFSGNEFFPAATAQLRTPFILRDYRAQTIIINPVQYNAATKTLRLCNELLIKLSVDENAAVVNPFIREKAADKVQSEYKEIYKKQFLNYASFQEKYTAVAEEGNMLIIANTAYMSAMQPFIQWKKQRGISVEMVDIATVGTTQEAIKNYVANYYTTKGLTFLLLVGDAQHITPYASPYGDCDNCYGYISGDDSYPELFVGRFSAESVADVTTQVNRTIKYEKYPQPGAAWYGTGLGIGSAEGPGDDNEMDFEHIRNIRGKLTSYGYTAVNEYYDGSQGVQDAAGDPNPQMVADAIEAGVSIMNYCGHGWDNGCATSGLSSTEVDALNNVDAHPFFFSVACVNGNFVGQTCFGESWLRATHSTSGEPTGAIGTYMATINQSWSPPMAGQDEMNDLLTEAHQNNIKRTFGGIGMNGCMLMNDEYGTAGDEMTDTWTCFGDPSFMVRTAAPKDMVVTHVLYENVGLTELTVYCDEEGATVSLMLNGEIIGTGTVVGGQAVISFTAVDEPGTIDVTVTAFNTMPYFGTVELNTTVGINDAGVVGLSLFPNPTSGILNISYALESQSAVSVDIYTTTGQLVYSKNYGTQAAGLQNITLDASGFSAGVYSLALRTEKGNAVKRVVVE